VVVVLEVTVLSGGTRGRSFKCARMGAGSPQGTLKGRLAKLPWDRAELRGALRAGWLNAGWRQGALGEAGRQKAGCRGGALRAFPLSPGPSAAA